MIRPLRRRHRWLWLGLALLLPLLYWAALAARPEGVPTQRLPAPITQAID